MLPKGVVLEEQETVLALVRRRLFRIVPRLLFASTLTLLPFFFFFPLIAMGWFGVIVFLTVFGFGLYALLKTFFSWRETHLLVTTKRVIDIECTSPFVCHMTDIPLEHITNIHVHMHGLWKIFQVGSLLIETNDMQTFDIECQHIHRPKHVRDLILEVQSIQMQDSKHV